MSPRRKQHVLYELVGLSWWTGEIFAVVVYLLIRRALPALGSYNAILRGVGKALHEWHPGNDCAGRSVADLPSGIVR